MSIEDAVGPILALAFVLGMSIESFRPRETQPRVRTPRWLEWFMQRPEAHQRHHEFGQHAGNYGDWPAWDKLLGTYRAPAGAPLPYGFGERATRRVGAMLLCMDVNKSEAPIAHHD